MGSISNEAGPNVWLNMWPRHFDYEYIREGYFQAAVECFCFNLGNTLGLDSHPSTALATQFTLITLKETKSIMKFSAATVLASLAGAMAAPGQQVQALDRRSGGGVCQGQFKNAVCCSEAATISGTLAIGLECESGSSEIS